jgi:uracil phosphoribosyltransferase
LFLYETEIETPLTKMKAEKLDEDIYAFLPILRAGMSMVEGILNIIPNAKVGHIGLFRNEETLEPTQYYFKVPHGIENRTVIILDPMIATGGSAVDAITSIKKVGVKKIKFLALIAAPEGLKKITDEHPDVEIYCTSIDSHLNENGYIVPGLGDAGDRIYGTK